MRSLQRISTTTSEWISRSPGPRGLCLLRQDAGGRFTDMTGAAKLPPALLRTPLYGVWPADVDTDGDLDLVLAPRRGTACRAPQ